MDLRDAAAATCNVQHLLTLQPVASIGLFLPASNTLHDTAPNKAKQKPGHHSQADMSIFTDIASRCGYLTGHVRLSVIDCFVADAGFCV